MNRPAITRKKSRFATWTLALLLLSVGAASAQNSSDDTRSDIRFDELGTVLRVHVEYANNEWRTLSAPEVIYCRPPKITPDPVMPAKIEILDVSGNILSRRFINDPRAYLPEDPRVAWSRADKAELVLEIELVGSPSSLEFTDDFENRAVPNLMLDLDAIILDYQTNGAKRIPNCEQTNPPYVAVRGRDFFVLEYALKFAADNSELTENQILEILERDGRRGIRKMRIRDAVRELLLKSLLNRN